MMGTYNPADVLHALPEVFLSVVAIVVLILSFAAPKQRGWIQTVSIIGVVGTGILLVRAGLPLFEPGAAAVSVFSGSYLVDKFAIFFKVVFLLATLLVILMSIDYLPLVGAPIGEFYAILLFSTVGMMFIASGGNLLTLYIGLETMSISLYILCGFLKRDKKSNEAALKYLLIGAFSSGRAETPAHAQHDVGVSGKIYYRLAGSGVAGEHYAAIIGI